MRDYILFTHGDCDEDAAIDWGPYLASLRSEGVLQGGSAIGSGQCMRRDGNPREVSERIVGFLRIKATDLAHVRQLLTGHPVYEAGGTIEVRELPRTD